MLSLAKALRSELIATPLSTSAKEVNSDEIIPKILRKSSPVLLDCVIFQGVVVLVTTEGLLFCNEVQLLGFVPL